MPLSENVSVSFQSGQSASLPSSSLEFTLDFGIHTGSSGLPSLPIMLSFLLLTVSSSQKKKGKSIKHSKKASKKAFFLYTKSNYIQYRWKRLDIFVSLLFSRRGFQKRGSTFSPEKCPRQFCIWDNRKNTEPISESWNSPQERKPRWLWHQGRNRINLSILIYFYSVNRILAFHIPDNQL